MAESEGKPFEVLRWCDDVWLGWKIEWRVPLCFCPTMGRLVG
jgi:hypothetical protein